MTRYRSLVMAFLVVALTLGGSSATVALMGRGPGQATVATVASAPSPRDGLIAGTSPIDLLIGTKRNDREPIGRLLLAVALVLLSVAARAGRGWAVGGSRNVPFRETSGHALRLRAPPGAVSFATR
jgi:hypothetical protein